MYWHRSYKVVNGVSDCDAVGSILPKGSPKFEIEATASDDSGLNVVLMTSEDFGCILHTPLKIKNEKISFKENSYSKCFAD